MPNGQEVSNSMPLTDAQRGALIDRMQSAWANLPDDKRAALKPIIEDADQQLGAYLNTGVPPDHSVHQILRLKSYLTNDWHGLVQRLDRPAAAQALEVSVGPDGPSSYFSRAFSELQSHYLFAEKFGRPAKGIDKGEVENLVGYARRNFLVLIPRASSWDELNARLEADCRARRLIWVVEAYFLQPESFDMLEY